MAKHGFRFWLLIALLALAACRAPAAGMPVAELPAVESTAAADSPAVIPAPDLGQPEAQQPAAKELPAAEELPGEPSATPRLTAAPAPGVCTPLAEIPLNALPGLVSNPFNPPRPGFDDPHAGLDLAVTLPDTQLALAGHPVQAALAGRVAMLIQDRFPFGYAVVIETPLADLPEAWQLAVEIPAPAPTLEPRSALTCPPGPEPEAASDGQRSLYILYAHLQAAPELELEDPVSCGQRLGTIGESGNALHPHLHFEARVAPAGIRLPGMAHYHASVNSEEMRAYCLWSVSGLFQLVDPRRVLSPAP